MKTRPFNCMKHGLYEPYPSTSGCRFCIRQKARARNQAKVAGTWIPRPVKPLLREPAAPVKEWLKCNHCKYPAKDTHDLWTHKFEHTGFYVEERSAISSALGWV